MLETDGYESETEGRKATLGPCGPIEAESRTTQSPQSRAPEASASGPLTAGGRLARTRSCQPLVGGEGSITLPPKTTPPEIVEEREREIRAVSPIMVDGGLAVWNSTLPDPPPRAARLLADVMAHPKGYQVELPFEDAAPGGGRAWADVTWNLSNGNRNVQLHVRGHVYIAWRPDLGEVEVQFKAPGLWMHGPKAMADYYLRSLHRLFFDGDCPFMELNNRKWRITQIPLCADFTGLDVQLADSHSFIGAENYEGRPVYIPATRIVGKTNPVQGVETLYIGKATSACQVVLYNKTAELASKATHSNVTTYRHVWEAHGWTEGEGLRRVELRLRDSGLTCRPFEAPDSAAVYDLRDPAALADQELLRKFWAYQTSRKRMVIADNDRPTRRSLDPRWGAVQAAAKVARHGTGAGPWSSRTMQLHAATGSTPARLWPRVRASRPAVMARTTMFHAIAFTGPWSMSWRACSRA